MRKIKKIIKSFLNPKRIIILDLDELISDKDLSYGWQANIAMSIKDEFCRFKVEQGILNVDRFKSFSDNEMHIVANNGAIRFLNQLSHKPK